MSTVNVSRDVLDNKKGKEVDVESLSSLSDNASREVALQVQEEEGHEIKFRSCSWQKVRLFTRYGCPPSSRWRPDGSLTILGVHLLSHPVIPLVCLILLIRG